VDKHPVADRNDGGSVNRTLRELSDDETYLVSGGNHGPIGGGGPGGGPGGGGPVQCWRTPGGQILCAY
jgi:hypothetical protein